MPLKLSIGVYIAKILFVKIANSKVGFMKIINQLTPKYLI